MTSFSLHDKVSGHEIKAWYLSSLELDTADGEAAWDSFMDHKPEDFKVPKKPRASKKSSTPSERADAEYMEDKCDTRVYKGGWGCQCSSKKVDGQFLCKRHQTEADAHDGMVKNGFVTGDRPTHHYGDESLTLITWHDVEVPTKVKAKKASGEKKVSTRKCSCCGETGHNKRNCPNKSDSAKPNTVANLKAALAAAEEKAAEEKAAEEKAAEEKAAEEKEEKAAEEKEVVGKKNKKNKKNKKKKSKNSIQVAEAVELDEDVSDDQTVAYGGEEIAEDKTETYGGDVGNMEDVEDVEEKEKEHIELTFEGVDYSRDEEDKVYDDDIEEVGTWNTDTQSIEFSKLGWKQHKHQEDRVAPGGEESEEEGSEEESEEEE
jgi:hypothetical protein